MLDIRLRIGPQTARIQGTHVDEQIEHFAYDRMVEQALRGVLREALKVTERQGLPGAHHFYITFHTSHPGVVLSPRLRSQHPDAMTIVLQNQFWDLAVDDDLFSVSLSFGGIRELLTIPFEAVTAFADPHATFGLQFQGALEQDDDEEDDEEDEDEDDDGIETDGPGRAAPPIDDQDDVRDGAKDNVVTLDTFRKKP